MSTPSHLSPEADALRATERAAIQRLARNVAAQAARAVGQKDAADASIGFIDMVLNQAFAARDAELESERRGARSEERGARSEE